MGPVELLQESGELPDRLPGGVAKCLCRPGLAVPEFMESEQKYKHASDYNKKINIITTINLGRLHEKLIFQDRSPI